MKKYIKKIILAMLMLKIYSLQGAEINKENNQINASIRQRITDQKNKIQPIRDEINRILPQLSTLSNDISITSIKLGNRKSEQTKLMENITSLEALKEELPNLTNQSTVSEIYQQYSTFRSKIGLDNSKSIRINDKNFTDIYVTLESSCKNLINAKLDVLLAKLDAISQKGLDPAFVNQLKLTINGLKLQGDFLSRNSLLLGNSAEIQQKITDMLNDDKLKELIERNLTNPSESNKKLINDLFDQSKSTSTRATEIAKFWSRNNPTKHLQLESWKTEETQSEAEKEAIIESFLTGQKSINSQLPTSLETFITKSTSELNNLTSEIKELETKLAEQQAEGDRLKTELEPLQALASKDKLPDLLTEILEAEETYNEADKTAKSDENKAASARGNTIYGPVRFARTGTTADILNEAGNLRAEANEKLLELIEKMITARRALLEKLEKFDATTDSLKDFFNDQELFTNLGIKIENARDRLPTRMEGDIVNKTTQDNEKFEEAKKSMIIKLLNNRERFNELLKELLDKENYQIDPEQGTLVPEIILDVLDALKINANQQRDIISTLSSDTGTDVTFTKKANDFKVLFDAFFNNPKIIPQSNKNETIARLEIFLSNLPEAFQTNPIILEPILSKAISYSITPNDKMLAMKNVLGALKDEDQIKDVYKNIFESFGKTESTQALENDENYAKIAKLILDQLPSDALKNALIELSKANSTNEIANLDINDLLKQLIDNPNAKALKGADSKLLIKFEAGQGGIPEGDESAVNSTRTTIEIPHELPGDFGYDKGSGDSPEITGVE